MSTVAICLKWVDRRPDVDPLTGAIVHDPRSAGTSEADDAALEWALRLGETWGYAVVAISAGPPDADSALRVAVASGASRAIRVPCLTDAPSENVAAAIVRALPDDVAVTVCGNWSLDRGSGSVPAFIAARQSAAQALGLVSLTLGEAPASEPDLKREPELRGERRLDGGRRERLRIPCPAVISVEGGSARLRRAALANVIAARTAPIEVAAPIDLADRADRARPAGDVQSGPFRPRSRARPAPTSDSARERILDLTGALVDHTSPQRLALDPPEAAVRLVAQLRAWGYIE